MCVCALSGFLGQSVCVCVCVIIATKCFVALQYLLIYALYSTCFYST